VKRKHVLLAAGAVLVTAVAVSVRPNDAAATRAYVQAVVRRDLESVVSGTGDINPRLKVNISAHVVGKIRTLYFAEGDHVKKGERLVDLEKDNYVAQKDRMVAELSSRKFDLVRASATLKHGESQLRRILELREQGIQSQEVLEQAQFECQAARATLGSAQEGVRQAEASLRQAKDDLSKTTLVSPIDGTVVQLAAREGEVVVTGTMNNPASVIAVVADLAEILVEADVSETEVVQIRPAQNVRVHIDAAGSREYVGHVMEIGNSAVLHLPGGLRYFRVKISLDNANSGLRPGMSASIDIVTEFVSDALTVPIQSIIERNAEPADGRTSAPRRKDSDRGASEKYVFVLAGGEVHMRSVRTGASSATDVVVTSGLSERDRIVTGPFRILKQLQDGGRVISTKEADRRDGIAAAEAP
jgi:HlyD family secretion protein